MPFASQTHLFQTFHIFFHKKEAKAHKNGGKHYKRGVPALPICWSKYTTVANDKQEPCEFKCLFAQFLKIMKSITNPNKLLFEMHSNK